MRIDLFICLYLLPISNQKIQFSFRKCVCFFCKSHYIGRFVVARHAFGYSQFTVSFFFSAYRRVLLCFLSFFFSLFRYITLFLMTHFCNVFTTFIFPDNRQVFAFYSVICVLAVVMVVAVISLHASMTILCPTTTVQFFVVVVALFALWILFIWLLFLELCVLRAMVLLPPLFLFYLLVSLSLPFFFPRRLSLLLIQGPHTT